MSADGAALAAACEGRQVWVAAVGPAPEQQQQQQQGGGEQPRQLLRPLGFVAAPADVSALAWLPAADGGRGALLAALSDGSLLHLVVPAGTDVAAAAGLELSAAEAPVLVARLEAPLVGMAVHKPASGRPLLYGLSAGKALVSYTLPGDAAGWQQAARARLKPAARVRLARSPGSAVGRMHLWPDGAWWRWSCSRPAWPQCSRTRLLAKPGPRYPLKFQAAAHQLPGGCLAVSPSGKVVLSAGADGCVALHDSELRPLPGGERRLQIELSQRRQCQQLAG
jgi:hypothetical protein